ncbi:hypothetical protein [Telmatospirillum siberiense]|uniref:Secreted protein n=1 Tax=Telmatospirillum siberiense TaxID=382514 RepID=A0A2N3PVJ8_9PROT|nr:hypothetical protein [Telmatospirillum siberiense]PKU24433.1 hypothetical protein CWS72_11330 [Telmatospirillum siberiense]
MRGPLVLGALLLATVCSSAIADERPSRYDMDAHCSRLANTNDGFSPEVMQKCLLTQSDALDQIKRVWPDTAEYIQRDCDLRARAGGDEDYALLQKCIRDQTRQATPDVVLPTVR